MTEEKSRMKKIKVCKGGGNAVYFFGFVGALYYFLQNAPQLVDKLWAIGKAFFWPAIIVFHIFSFLKIA